MILFNVVFALRVSAGMAAWVGRRVEQEAAHFW